MEHPSNDARPEFPNLSPEDWKRIRSRCFWRSLRQRQSWYDFAIVGVAGGLGGWLGLKLGLAVTGGIRSRLCLLCMVLVAAIFGAVGSAIRGSYFNRMMLFQIRAELGTHCRQCGYDLRASKERCPECGTAVPAALDRKE